MDFTSLESEGSVVFVERQTIDYICPAGHTFDMTFTIDAKVPDVWDCPQCSQKAPRVGAEDFVKEKTMKPQKTYQEQLQDRRSVGKPDVLLGERLEAYQSGHRR